MESSWLLYFLLWVPSLTCITVATQFHPHCMHAPMCMRHLVVRSKVTSCRLWLDRYNMQGAGFGALQVREGIVTIPGSSDQHGDPSGEAGVLKEV
jgi:hypothetical protein